MLFKHGWSFLHPPLQKCWHGTTILHGEIRGHYGKQLWQRARYLYRLHDKRCAAAKIIQDAVTKAGLWGTDQQLAFPIITKFGVNQRGKTVHYYFNYSASPVHFTYPYGDGNELLLQEAVQKNKQLQLDAWGVKLSRKNNLHGPGTSFMAAR